MEKEMVTMRPPATTGGPDIEVAVDELVPWMVKGYGPVAKAAAPTEEEGK